MFLSQVLFLFDVFQCVLYYLHYSYVVQSRYRVLGLVESLRVYVCQCV